MRNVMHSFSGQMLQLHELTSRIVLKQHLNILPIFFTSYWEQCSLMIGSFHFSLTHTFIRGECILYLSPRKKILLIYFITFEHSKMASVIIWVVVYAVSKERQNYLCILICQRHKLLLKAWKVKKQRTILRLYKLTPATTKLHILAVISAPRPEESVIYLAV